MSPKEDGVQPGSANSADAAAMQPPSFERQAAAIVFPRATPGMSISALRELVLDTMGAWNVGHSSEPTGAIVSIILDMQREAA